MRRRAVRFIMLTGADIEPTLTSAQTAGREKTHVFADGFEDQEHVTVGCSRKGRFWSWRDAKHVIEWRDWCDRIGGKISNDKIPVDAFLEESLLPTDLESRPDFYPLAIDWPGEFYENSETNVVFTIAGQSISLYDVELQLIEPSKDKPLRFAVSGSNVSRSFNIDFSKTGVSYKAVEGDIDLSIRGRKTTLTKLFSTWHPIVRYEQDSFSRGSQLVRPKQPFTALFDVNKIDVWDWSGVDLTRESQTLDKHADSIQRRVIETLIKTEPKYEVVYDDDGKGEAADVIAVVTDDKYLSVDLFHCKYSKADVGARVKDLYELCGQAEKSIKWRERVDRFLQHLVLREASRKKKSAVSRYESGDPKTLHNIALKSRFLFPRFRVFVVQPGLSKQNVTKEQLSVLASSELLLMETFEIPLRVIASA